MKSCVTICQVYVWETLKPIANDCYFVHYMDDILFGYSNADHFKKLLTKITKVLLEKGLQVPAERVQYKEPYLFLEPTINNNTIKTKICN